MQAVVEFEYPEEMTLSEFDSFIKTVKATADACGVKVRVSGKRLPKQMSTPSGFVRKRAPLRPSP